MPGVRGKVGVNQGMLTASAVYGKRTCGICGGERMHGALPGYSVEAMEYPNSYLKLQKIVESCLCTLSSVDYDAVLANVFNGLYCIP